jgi:lysophospholipase L1-like esterase
MSGALLYQRYVALGDSISIDDYPGLDRQETEGLRAPVPGLGAASLLHHNADDVWPGFRGADLRTLCPGVRFDGLAVDGARTSDVLERQLPLLGTGDRRPTLVTLTVGGNDLLAFLWRGAGVPGPHDADRIVGAIAAVLDRLERLFPQRAVLIGTIYDPSDGASRLLDRPLGPPERAVLDRVNDGIRQLARRRDAVLLADIATRFAGHGLSAPVAERWYWPHMIIEPSARGASEVRRLWLEALGVGVSADRPSPAPDPARPGAPSDIFERALTTAIGAKDHSPLLGTWEASAVLRGEIAVGLVEALGRGDKRVSEEMLVTEVRKAIRAARYALRENGAYDLAGMRGVTDHWRSRPAPNPEDDELRQQGTLLMWARMFSVLKEVSEWTEAQWLEGEIEEVRDLLARAADEESRSRLRARLAGLEAELKAELTRAPEAGVSGLAAT